MAAESIEEIHVEVAPLNIRVTDNPEPKDGMEGKFSLQLAAALALLYGSGKSSLFTDDTISQPAVKDLMKKVRVVSKLSFQETEAHLTVKLKGGTHYRRRVVAPKGNPRNPLTFEDIAEKVSDLAAKTLPRRRIGRIIEIVRSLERLDNSALLVRLCCTDRNSGRRSEVAPS
jgi:2-methylcitrate dehydratase PrpD